MNTIIYDNTNKTHYNQALSTEILTHAIGNDYAIINKDKLPTPLQTYKAAAATILENPTQQDPFSMHTTPPRIARSRLARRGSLTRARSGYNTSRA
ncbi:MAG: hypothetical protein PUB96_08635 [Helicobacteraceae bacterium]|nr:hypothetical protein [Helicobacteraceae bacterium]